MEGGGRRAHTQEETWTALYRLPGRKRVRREAALQSGAATKARRLMTRRAPRPVVLVARGRRGGRCGARGRWPRRGARAVGRPSGDAWARAVAGGGARALRRQWAAGQKQSRGEARVTEEEEAGRSQKDLFAIWEISRDSSVNKDFPLIQNSNERNV
jgi:hypothetical protein